MGDLRRQVFARDDWRCLAPLLDTAVSIQDCRGPLGLPALFEGSTYRVDALTLEHVHEEPGMRKIDRADHCLTLCWLHNVDSGWSQSHRAEENAHLDALYGRERRVAT